MEVSTDKRSFTTLYQGNEIIVNPDIMKGFLASMGKREVIPGAGYCIDYSNKAIDNLPGFEEEETFNELFEERHADTVPKTASHLTLNNRLLHHIVVHTILPHEGSGTTFNRVHLCILWCLTRRIPINLSYAIVAHMMYTRKHGKHAYPYATVITRFVMEKFTTITREPLVVECPNFELRHLFKKDGQGNWIKTPSNADRVASALSRSVTSQSTGHVSSHASGPSYVSAPISSQAAGTSSYSPPSYEPFSTDMPPPPPAFDHAHAYGEIISRLDGMNSNFETVNSRLNGMDTRVQDMSARVGSLSNYFVREAVNNRATIDSYGQVLANVEICHRHLCNRIYNMNRRMGYMDEHLASQFH